MEYAIFNDKCALYKAYMPQIKQGGLFIMTPASYQLGDAIKIQVQLPDDSLPVELETKVVWLSASHQQPKGVGVQFNDLTAGAALKTAITGCLANFSDDVVTYTL